MYIIDFFVYYINVYILSGFKWQPSGHLIVFAIQADDDYNLNSQTHSETFDHCVLLNAIKCVKKKRRAIW